MLTLALLLLCPALAAWPDDEAWVPLVQATGSCGADERESWDVASDAPRAPIDLVGPICSGLATAAWCLDDSSVYLRMRLDSTPLLAVPDQLANGAWGVIIDHDGDTSAYEALIVLDSATGSLSLWQNSVVTGEDWQEPAELQLWTASSPFLDEQARVAAAGSSELHTADAFLDLALPRDELLDQLGLEADAIFNLAFATGTGSTAGALDADLIACEGTSFTCRLSAQALRPLAFDGDLDGLHALDEAQAGTRDNDADCDDDGLLDPEDLAAGTDPLLCDTDGDGLSDGLELGVTERHEDSTEACFRADADPDTSTDPLAWDSDGDGLGDAEEDQNLDGEHSAYESDPSDPTDGDDSDGDGLIEGVEAWCEGGSSSDRDGDGIPDATEGLWDGDGDGHPAFCDQDSDDDGLSDATEGSGDTDGDGFPDYIDLDSDDDGSSDASEGSRDGDCDDLPAYRDPQDEDGPCGDPDGDGVLNRREARCGTDPSDPGSYPSSAQDCKGGGGLPDDSANPHARYHGGWFGGGCSSAPAPLGGGALWLLVAALLAAGRRRGPIAAILVATLLCAQAQAQDLDVQLFRPVPGSGAFLRLADAQAGRQGYGAALYYNHGQNLFVYHYDDPELEDERVVAALGTLDLLPWGSWGPLRLALDLPLNLLAQGDGVSGPTLLGDLALDGRLLLLDRARRPVGLLLRARGTLPTGNEESWLGEGRPTASLEAGASAGRRWVVAANLGMGTASSTRLDDIWWGPRVLWGAGLNAPITDPLYLAVELTGTRILASAQARGAHPVEAQLALRSRPVGRWVGSVGMASGVSRGVGAPGLRLVAGLAWVPHDPQAEPGLFADPDRDGLVSERDACPTQGEDFNGQRDRDGCPDDGLAPLRLRLLDSEGAPLAAGSVDRLEGAQPAARWRFEQGSFTRSLEPGRTRLRVSAPGHATLDLRLELIAGEATVVSCRLPQLRAAQGGGGGLGRGAPTDADGDGLLGADDLCPDQPEDDNGQLDSDGCPDGYLTTTRFQLNDAHGRPLPSGLLLLVSGPSVGAWTAPGGALSRALVPGDYLLAAQAQGYLPHEARLLVPEAQEHRVELTLDSAGSQAWLAMQVRDLAGRALAAQAWLAGPIDLLSSSDSSGLLELALPAGSYDLRVSSPGFGSHRAALALQAGERRQLVLDLQPLPASAASGDLLAAPVGFQAGSTRVAPEAQASLRQLADLLRADEGLLVVSLEGAVPPLGEQGGEDLRSLALARAVAEWLLEHEAIPPERLSVAGLGSAGAVPVEGAPSHRVRVQVAARLESQGGALELR